MHVAISEATLDGLKVVMAQFGDIMTGKTPVDPNLPTVLNHEVSGHFTELVVFSI